MNSSPAPDGPGSAAGAPNLPEGFTGTFTSRYVDTGDLRQHVVTGGQGPRSPTDQHNSAVRRARLCLRKELSCPSRAKFSPPRQY